MDLISILSTVILITTIGTMGVAVAAYIAFKVRDRRKPQKKDPTVESGQESFEPIFLTPYEPPAPVPGQTVAAKEVPGAEGHTPPLAQG